MEDDADVIWAKGLFFDETVDAVTAVELPDARALSEPPKKECFSFGGVMVTLLPPHDWCTASPSAHVWRGSLLLTWFLSKKPADLLKEKDFLEVGCGRAMVGLYASAVGARVTLSDCDDRALAVLSEMESDRLRIRHLLWESDLEGSGAKHWSDAHRVEKVLRLDSKDDFDVIAGSDCLYFHSQELPLVAVLKRRLRKNGIAFFTVQRRVGTFCCDVRNLFLRLLHFLIFCFRTEIHRVYERAWSRHVHRQGAIRLERYASTRNFVAHLHVKRRRRPVDFDSLVEIAVVW